MHGLRKKKPYLHHCSLVSLVYFLANIFRQERYPIIENSVYPTDIFFIVVTPVIIIFAIILVTRHGIVGSHAISWILFLAGATVEYTADLTYYYNAEYMVENNNSYFVDYLYYFSYFLYFGFMIFYLIPRRNKISKEMILLGILVSTIFVVPAVYFVSQISDTHNVETEVNLVYPFLSSMVFVPSFVAMILFFRGMVNFLWITITLGIICVAVGDVVFLVERYFQIYSANSLANLFFAWQWIFFAFGVYSHIRIFGAKNM